MKTLRKILSIGHVGAYKRFSQADQGRHIHCVAWLLRNDRDFLSQTKWKHDSINLKYNRDFLKEDLCYDIVIVHSIFHTEWPVVKKYRDKAKISVKHTIDNWRQRLISTSATYLFICEGQPFSLSGYNLGVINGYKIKYQDHMVTIYKKI
jgi:hypothetical protein